MSMVSWVFGTGVMYSWCETLPSCLIHTNTAHVGTLRNWVVQLIHSGWFPFYIVCACTHTHTHTCACAHRQTQTHTRTHFKATPAVLECQLSLGSFDCIDCNESSVHTMMNIIIMIWIYVYCCCYYYPSHSFSSL